MLLLEYILCFIQPYAYFLGFPGGPDGKERTCNAAASVRSLSWKDAQEEGTATHSIGREQRIPWTEEPGGLQSMGLPTVRRDLVT